MASRGSSISGSVTVSQRISSLPCHTRALMFQFSCWYQAKDRCFTEAGFESPGAGPHDVRDSLVALVECSNDANRCIPRRIDVEQSFETLRRFPALAFLGFMQRDLMR